MTLEPVHIKAISDLASSIDISMKQEDDDDATDLLELLSELKHDGKVVLKALGRVNRGKVNIERMALSKDPFEITYACDSGSTNPVPFDSGLFVDFCHCALASTPTDLELQRSRTIVASTYSPSNKVTINTTGGWVDFDEGKGRGNIIRIQPGLLEKRIKRMVHDIALYLAESEHILWMKDRLDPEGFFIMDGPIYPKQLMYWMVVESEEIQIRYDPNARKILQNYIDVMDHHIEKQIPLIGFVKNPEDMQIIHTLKKQAGRSDLPWVLDSQFFKRVLSPEGDEKKERNYITYTNWFIQPNQFYERMLKSTSPLVEDSLEHKFDHEDYSMTFFMVFIPWMNVVFKIESPYGLTKNEENRDMITRKVLYDICVSGVPKTLSKADSVAKIKISERKQVIEQFREQRIDTIYNDVRWGENDD